MPPFSPAPRAATGEACRLTIASGFNSLSSFLVAGRHPIVAVWSPRGQLRTRTELVPGCRWRRPMLPLSGFLATLAGTQTYDPLTASQPVKALSAAAPRPHPGLLLRDDRLHGAVALEPHRLPLHGPHHRDDRRLRGGPSARPGRPALRHDGHRPRRGHHALHARHPRRNAHRGTPRPVR